MHTTRQSGRFTMFNLTALMGLIGLCAFTVWAATPEQPKPGPEHNKMQAWVGEWTYEGTAEASPLVPASKFKGKETSRMVLGGFFLEMRDEGQVDTGYSFQAVILHGYDPATRTYISYGFENDGTVYSSSGTCDGTTWTSSRIRGDHKGTSYKTRSVSTLSADGKSMMFSAEYSANDGAAWLPLWKGTMKKVAK
jgi:hypothetical protein